MQLAFVPTDIEKALSYWAGTLGAGPFFHLPELSLPETRYRGVRSDPVFSLWLGYWGDMQIELIRQHNEAPSIYRDCADDRRLHHVCLLVEDFAAAMTAAGDAVVMQEGQVPGGGSVAYVQPAHGPLVEVLQPAPGTRELFQMMREAHRDWDGRDPVRAIG
jgi:methylmalonyl-CoA/ethylmalonyl-CoA epimerase